MRLILPWLSILIVCPMTPIHPPASYASSATISTWQKKTIKNTLPKSINTLVTRATSTMGLICFETKSKERVLKWKLIKNEIIKTRNLNLHPWVNLFHLNLLLCLSLILRSAFNLIDLYIRVLRHNLHIRCSHNVLFYSQLLNGIINILFVMFRF